MKSEDLVSARCPSCGITVLKSSDSVTDYCSACVRHQPPRTTERKK